MTKTKADIARENGKKGGRPPGRKNNATLEKEAVLKAMQQRIMSQADHLLDAQFTIALGQTFLFKIEKYYVKEGKGKGKKLIVKDPKLVTDVEEIRMYLQGIVDEENTIEAGETPERSKPDDDYYFITTKEPSNQALESVFKRTFGNAVQPIAFTDEDGKSIFDDESKTKTDKALGAFLGKAKVTKKKGAAKTKAKGTAKAKPKARVKVAVRK